MSDREIHHHHGSVTALVLGAGIGACLVLRDQTESIHAAAAPSPAPVRTVIVYTIARTIQAHSRRRGR
jgi:hypothetical protein